MSIFDSLGVKQNAPMSPQQVLARLRNDPVGTLKQAGLDVPAGMNDPRQIIDHLLKSGQVSNPRLQMAQQMMGMLGRR